MAGLENQRRLEGCGRGPSSAGGSATDAAAATMSRRTDANGRAAGAAWADSRAKSVCAHRVGCSNSDECESGDSVHWKHASKEVSGHRAAALDRYARVTGIFSFSYGRVRAASAVRSVMIALISPRETTAYGEAALSFSEDASTIVSAAALLKARFTAASSKSPVVSPVFGCTPVTPIKYVSAWM